MRQVAEKLQADAVDASSFLTAASQYKGNPVRLSRKFRVTRRSGYGSRGIFFRRRMNGRRM
ncbi:hypothetical protein LJK88_12790 [Paenibacillus sp. P26]|nr:hypothetical protein LJK88_12790 [Paenibacillus sp. P26]